MPLQDRFIFNLGFILTVIFISLILVNLRWSFFGDATQVIRESDPDDYDWEAATPVDATDIRKLAEQEYAEAQGELGSMYYIGQGVPQDDIRTYAWFNLVASQGNTNVAGFCNSLANFMTPQQIAAAQELTVELQNKIENRSSAATSETEK